MLRPALRSYRFLAGYFLVFTILYFLYPNFALGALGADVRPLWSGDSSAFALKREWP